MFIQRPSRLARISQRWFVNIRWLGLMGQCAALDVAIYGFGYDFPPAVWITVGFGIIINLFAQCLQPGARGRRLTENDATVYLLCDTIQVAMLLYFTGGLFNPFALLLLAPLTVAAAVLSARRVMAITIVTILSFLSLGRWYYDVLWNSTPLPMHYALGLIMALISAAIFIAGYVFSVASAAARVDLALAASEAALARERKISALGALAAAVAHELGSPLSTIAVVARELSRDIARNSPLYDDVQLLLTQSERCGKILAELSATEDVSPYAPITRAPLSSMLPALAERYLRPGVRLDVEVELKKRGRKVTGRPMDSEVPEDPPLAWQPELTHALANLLQNAIQFARRRVIARIFIEPDRLTLAMIDDGPGFPPSIIDRLGEPYISQRPNAPQHLSNHMGLGIFIATTLLERMNAEISFMNDPEGGGARVTISWDLAALPQTNLPEAL